MTKRYRTKAAEVEARLDYPGGPLLVKDGDLEHGISSTLWQTLFEPVPDEPDDTVTVKRIDLVTAADVLSRHNYLVLASLFRSALGEPEPAKACEHPHISWNDDLRGDGKQRCVDCGMVRKLGPWEEGGAK